MHTYAIRLEPLTHVSKHSKSSVQRRFSAADQVLHFFILTDDVKIAQPLMKNQAQDLQSRGEDIVKDYEPGNVNGDVFLVCYQIQFGFYLINEKTLLQLLA